MKEADSYHSWTGELESYTAQEESSVLPVLITMSAATLGISQIAIDFFRLRRPVGEEIPSELGRSASVLWTGPEVTEA